VKKFTEYETEKEVKTMTKNNFAEQLLIELKKTPEVTFENCKPMLDSALNIGLLNRIQYLALTDYLQHNEAPHHSESFDQM
jgi:hypothetical protein